MSPEFLRMVTIFYGIITFVVVIAIIILTIKKLKTQYKNTLIELERSKNLIISGAILAELNKI